MISLRQIICGISVLVSIATYAESPHPLLCKNFHVFKEIKAHINQLDPQFSWEDSNCKVVATKSLFPKQLADGRVEFASGIYLYIYQNYQLKFICLPSQECKAW